MASIAFVFTSTIDNSKNTHLLFEDNFDSNMPKHISVYSLRYPLTNSLYPEPQILPQT